MEKGKARRTQTCPVCGQTLVVRNNLSIIQIHPPKPESNIEPILWNGNKKVCPGSHMRENELVNGAKLLSYKTKSGVYNTEVILRIQIEHYSTHSPKELVEAAKLTIRQNKIVSNCEQVGEAITVPEWPWKAEDEREEVTTVGTRNNGKAGQVGSEECSVDEGAGEIVGCSEGGN